MLLKKICFLIVFANTCHHLSSQAVNGQLNYFYQEQLDYLPHFKLCNLDGMGGAPFGTEFSNVLEVILNYCSSSEYTLESYPGLDATRSGISFMRGVTDSYFTLELSKLGKVVNIEVYKTPYKEQLKMCLLETLNDSYINPAIKDNAPVASFFVFIFK